MVSGALPPGATSLGYFHSSLCSVMILQTGYVMVTRLCSMGLANIDPRIERDYGDLTFGSAVAISSI